MPKDYKNISNNKKNQGGKPGQFSNMLSFVTGLSLGLLVAVIIYFTGHDTSAERKKFEQVTALEETVTAKADEDKALKVAKVPEPQFDFYKILPRKEVNISEWVTEEQDQPDIITEEPGIFVLQVGSFQEYDAADEVKAKLAMMGITADIQRVVINGQDVRHRVRVGPYKDPAELQMARDRLLANDLDFMLLKLKMEDI